MSDWIEDEDAMLMQLSGELSQQRTSKPDVISRAGPGNSKIRVSPFPLSHFDHQQLNPNCDTAELSIRRSCRCLPDTEDIQRHSEVCFRRLKLLNCAVAPINSVENQTPLVIMKLVRHHSEVSTLQ
jgi:hypothetical protein